jgi:hypothetical protein
VQPTVADFTTVAVKKQKGNGVLAFYYKTM